MRARSRTRATMEGDFNMKEVIYPPSEQVTDVEIERCDTVWTKPETTGCCTGVVRSFGPSRDSKQEDGKFIKYLLPSLEVMTCLLEWRKPQPATH